MIAFKKRVEIWMKFRILGIYFNKWRRIQEENSINEQIKKLINGGNNGRKEKNNESVGVPLQAIFEESRL